MTNKVDDIATFLFKSKQSGTMMPSDTTLRHQVPLKPGIFHGRDDLIEEIARLLVKNPAHVCLLGPGGMGKTSVSLAVVELPLIKEHFPGNNCVWVPCIEATSAVLLLNIMHIQLQVPGDKQVTLEKIITHLKASTQPHLLLLDNFETPWNSPGQKEVEDILRQLAELSHIAIFITMRGRAPCDGSIKWQWKNNIRPTDEEACLRIYRDNNPSSKDSDADIVLLLKALGYMPFAVTLMAKLGMEGMSTARELLDAWCESGPDLLSDDREASMNRSVALSVDSDLVKRNPNAIALLTILSLLPAGTTKENLRWWALDSALKPSMIPSAIATLSKAALLVENEGQNSDSPVLFVIPVIQSFMQHGRIDENIQKQMQTSCVKYVLDHACRFDDSAFPIKSKALAAEATNIQYILLGLPHTTLSNRTIEALIGFAWHRCDTKPDPEIANHVVNVANASGVKRYIASAIWCLGWTYCQLGDHGSSYHHLHEAYLLSDDPSSGDLELQRLHCRCGTELVEVARMASQDGHEVVSLARDVERSCAALSDDHLHGLSLVRLGDALNKAQQPQEALEHLYRGRSILKAVKNAPYLAAACHVIAHVHYRQRKIPEALDAIQEAWELVESSSNSNIQALISLESGLIHFSANRDAEAWKHVEIALMKASHVGNRYAIARTLELMGYGYLRRGDYKNAYGAYEAAAEKYRGTVAAHVETRCKDNMAKIKTKQRSPDMEVGFARLGWDVDKSPLFPLLQAS